MGFVLGVVFGGGGGRGGGGAFEKVVIPGSHCVFYFKDLTEKCTAPVVALSSGKR